MQQKATKQNVESYVYAHPKGHVQPIYIEVGKLAHPNAFKSENRAVKNTLQCYFSISTNFGPKTMRGLVLLRQYIFGTLGIYQIIVVL